MEKATDRPGGSALPVAETAEMQLRTLPCAEEAVAEAQWLPGGQEGWGPQIRGSQHFFPIYRTQPQCLGALMPLLFAHP